MAYNEDEDDIVVIRNGRKNRGIVRQAGREAANELFKTRADDSALKTVFVWTMAAYAAYFGGKFLMNNLGETIKEREVETIKQNANANPNSAAGLASQFASAFQTTDGASIYAWTDVNENVIFGIFEGGRIGTREFFMEIGAAYSRLTKGRNLLTDLQNEMGSFDYNRIKPRIDKILATARKKTALKGLPGASTPGVNAPAQRPATTLKGKADRQGTFTFTSQSGR